MSYFGDKVREFVSTCKKFEQQGSSFQGSFNVGFAFQQLMTDISKSNDTREKKEVINLLCDALTEEYRFLGDNVMHGLIKFDRELLVEPMIAALKDRRKYVRERAASVLSAVTGKKFFWGSQNPAKWQPWPEQNK
jgi:hypothetical protein